MFRTRILLLLAGLFLTGTKLSAQVDPFAALDSGANTGPDYVTATFKGTRLINYHTVEVPGKKTLDFRISHRFGDISTGPKNFYGLDGPATIWLGLDYSFDGRLAVGIGRVNTDKLITSNLKYKLLRQTLGSNKMPVTMTLLAGMNYTTAEPSWGDEQYHYTTSRMSYVYQLMIARKFNRAFSLQLSPTMLHYNLVLNTTDKNDVFALVGLARYKFSRSTAITAEYALRTNGYTADMSQYQNCASIGFDIETGGHVFQFFFTNSFGIAETQTIPYSTGKTDKGQFKLGFNISRQFSY